MKTDVEKPIRNFGNTGIVQFAKSIVINVIGSGIAGSLVTRLLRRAGHEVLVFDDNDQYSGSRASSNLYHSSWIRKFSSNQAYKGIQTLETLFPPEQINKPFSGGIADAIKVKHISQKYLLVEPDVTDKVVQLKQGPVPELVTASQSVFKGPAIVCTGARAGELIEGLNPEILVGHCLLLKGRLDLGAASLKMHSPYRHAKCYQFDEDTIYYANSLRLKPTSFAKREREVYEELENGARKLLPDMQLYPIKEYRIGYRPIIKGYEFGQLQRCSDMIWSINGGGKQGIVAYAFLAQRLLEEISSLMR